MSGSAVAKPVSVSEMGTERLLAREEAYLAVSALVWWEIVGRLTQRDLLRRRGTGFVSIHHQHKIRELAYHDTYATDDLLPGVSHLVVLRLDQSNFVVSSRVQRMK